MARWEVSSFRGCWTSVEIWVNAILAFGICHQVLSCVRLMAALQDSGVWDLWFCEQEETLLSATSEVTGHMMLQVRACCAGIKLTLGDSLTLLGSLSQRLPVWLWVQKPTNASETWDTIFKVEEVNVGTWSIYSCSTGSQVKQITWRLTTQLFKSFIN